MSEPVIIIITPGPKPGGTSALVEKAVVDNTGFDRAIELIEGARETGGKVRIVSHED